MHEIIILGDKEDKILTKCVTKVCEENGGVLLFEKDSIYQSQENPEFLIDSFHQEYFKIHDDFHRMIIFGENFRESKKYLFNHNIIAVLNPENQEAVKEVGELGCDAIGCSLSGKDTLTLSSLSGNQYLISLMRSIDLKKDWIFPQDFLIRSNISDFYSILAASAVMLLNGKDCSKGFDIFVDKIKAVS